MADDANSHAAVGRPFIVSGRAKRASLVEDRSWTLSMFALTFDRRPSTHKVPAPGAGLAAGVFAFGVK
jgi:hypothetical protein